MNNHKNCPIHKDGRADSNCMKCNGVDNKEIEGSAKNAHTTSDSKNLTETQAICLMNKIMPFDESEESLKAIKQALHTARTQGKREILDILNQQHKLVDVRSVVKSFLSNTDVTN